MKAKTVGFVIFLLTLFASNSLAQETLLVACSFQVLTDSCNGGDPLPDGTSVHLYWDQNANGPDGADLPPPLCPAFPCVHFNTFLLNGEEQMGAPGTFCTDPAISFEFFPQPNRFYLRVFVCDHEIVWTSQVFTVEPGIQELELEDWTCGPCEPPPPGQVTGLQASQDLCNQIRLTWEPAQGAWVYGIVRDGAQLTLVPGLSFIDSTLPPSPTCHTYQVRAISEYGVGPISDPVTGCLGTALPAVTGVTASRNLDDRILLSWANMANESGFEIWRTESGHVRRYEKIAEVAANITTFNDFSAAAGRAYSYRVNGINPQCGRGLPSTEALGRRVLVEPVEFREIVVTTNLAGATCATATDFDADGDKDVIASGMFADRISWYENDGAWQFTEHPIVTHWDGARKFQLIDLDNDGDRDIVGVARFANQLAWWEKTPQGFTMHVISSSVMGACDFVVTDIATNGAWDIVTAAYTGGEISIWANDGNEQFTRTVIANNFAGVSSVSTTNIDNDFDVDIIATGQIADEVAYFVQQPNHSFEKVVWARANGACDARHVPSTETIFFCAKDEPLVAVLEGPSHELREITRRLSEPRFVSWGDVDHDEDADLLLAANSEISWWRKSQNRYYRNIVTDDLPQASYVVGAMIEGDGGLDLIVTGGSEVRLYLSSTDSMTVGARTIERNAADEVVGQTSVLPEYSLEQNYPNPFNAITQIQFSLADGGTASLVVFDIEGREVARLLDGELNAGVHSVAFDASALASGVYFYRLTSGQFVDTKKMVVLN